MFRNMKNIGNYIVCHKQVCKIMDIKNDLYVLKPIDESSLTLQVPTNSIQLEYMLWIRLVCLQTFIL